MDWYKPARDIMGWIKEHSPFMLKRTHQQKVQTLQEELANVDNHIYEDDLMWLKSDPRKPDKGKTLICKRCWEADHLDIRLVAKTNQHTGEITAICEQCRSMKILREGTKAQSPVIVRRSKYTGY